MEHFSIKMLFAFTEGMCTTTKKIVRNADGGSLGGEIQKHTADHCSPPKVPTGNEAYIVIQQNVITSI